MLLRIEAYPAEAPLHPSPKPLYACLATSGTAGNITVNSNDADTAGRLITVGRKTGDVTFDDDKSVSREHCILRLVSVNENVAGILHSLTAPLPPPMKPRNPEEIKACDNDLQMCVVLENIGKVGSFVVQERPPADTNSRRRAGRRDNSDTEDETEDEGNAGIAVPASQTVGGVRLSPIAEALIPDLSTVTLKYVGPGQSIVLEQICTTTNSDKPVIVQCGKLGSTIVIQRKQSSGTGSGTPEWSPDSWKNKTVSQPPKYEDEEELEKALNTLKGLSPLVFAGEVRSLHEQLALACSGQAFLLMGGDGAEAFNEFNVDHVRDIFRVILQMALVLTFGAALPVIKVGRMAGQFAKPGSEPLEVQDGAILPSYRRGIINSEEFTAEPRRHKPDSMIDAYHQSAQTLNILRAFSTGGYADISRLHAWNLDFVEQTEGGSR
jgi:hypothetical protein